MPIRTLLSAAVLALTAGAAHAATNVVAVPEPSTYAIFGVGLVALALIRRTIRA